MSASVMGRAIAWLAVVLASAPGGAWAQQNVAAAPGAKPGPMWALEHINWSPQLARASASAVVVAVIDTGVDYYHRDLSSDNFYFSRNDPLDGRDTDRNGYIDDVIGWNFVDGNGNPWDHAGHGTHIAGILAARGGNKAGIAGMVPSVRILPLKVLNFIGQGRASRVAEAIYYAVAKGARVINLSLGGEEASGAARRAVEYAAGKNVVVVVAAGNDGKEVSRSGLAGLPNVITVGATGPDDRRAGFSNYGRALDIVAPGVDILSLRARRSDVALVAGVRNYQPGANFVGEKAHYYRVSGTSFATPYVAGAAALIVARKPQLDAASVKRMILHSARDVGAPGVDPDTGYGLLDVSAAVAADPAYFVVADIAAVAAARRDDGVVVRVTGTADADKMARAWIEIGQGESPQAWERGPGNLDKTVRDGVLDEIPAQRFAGAAVWTLRLVVEHANGKRRETRHVLRLG